MRRLGLILVLAAACGRPPGVIGLVLPLSGATALQGTEVAQGVGMALSEVAEAERPGLLTFDCGGTWQGTMTAFEALVREGATVVVGPLGADNMRAAGPLAARLGVPLLAPSLASAAPARGDDFVLSLCCANETVVRAMATFARDELRLERVAIVLDLSSPTALVLADGFDLAFHRLLGEVVGEVTYYGGSAAVPGLLDAALALDVEGLLLAGSAPDVVRMVQSARDPRLAEVVLLGVQSLADESLAGALTGRVKGAYRAVHFSPDEPRPGVQAFVAAYRKHLGEDPSVLAALGYDAARAVLQVFEPSLGGAAIRRRLLALRRFEGVTGRVDMNRSGNPLGKGVVLEQLHDPGRSRFVARMGQ